MVVENYTPRVLDQLGLDYEALRADRPDLIMVRMPGFGLDGPWRDNAAFAFVIEDASGLTWLTGHPDQLPFEPYCIGDPNAGLHALFGLLLALEHRRRTGEGGLVEAAMVDAALNVTAEQVIEYSAYGALLEPRGNRGPSAAPRTSIRPPGPTRTAATTAGSPSRWPPTSNGRRSAGRWASPAGPPTPRWRPQPGGVREQDRDRRTPAGLVPRSGQADEVVERLWAAGVPVGKVVQPHHQPELPQLQSRGFFEDVLHPVTGPPATAPCRCVLAGSGATARRHAPLLGEHNAEMLGELGLSRSEIDALEARRNHRWLARVAGLSTAAERRILRGWGSRRLRSTSSRRPVVSGWSAGIPRRPRAWPSSRRSSARTSSSTTRCTR